jgi:hypothetical protein
MSKTILTGILTFITAFAHASFAAEHQAGAHQEKVAIDGIEYRTKQLPAPFQLNEEEQAATKMVLEQWERESSKFKNFSCRFHRWNYRDPWNKTELSTGTFRIDDQGRFTFNAEAVDHFTNRPAPIVGTRWVFDGKTLTEVHPATRSIIDHQLQQPSGFRVPFVLQANAKELAERFYIRILNHNKDKHEICLQFHRRTALERSVMEKFFGGWSCGWDWRSYDHIDLILSDESFVPVAIQLHNDRFSREAYSLSDVEINTSDTSGWFSVEAPNRYKRTTFPTNLSN